MKSPAHPGRLIKNELDEMGLDIVGAAKALGVTLDELQSVINGEAPLTPEIAVRLERHIGSTAAAWIGMQAAHDRRRLSLTSLMAQCELDEGTSKADREWMDAPDVGREVCGSMSYVGILDGSGSTWGVRVPDLPGCHGAGSSPSAAVRDAASAAQEWLEHRAEKGRPIPFPRAADAIIADPDVEFRPELGEIAVVVV